jgi:hypothetical protein
LGTQETREQTGTVIAGSHGNALEKTVQPRLVVSLIGQCDPRHPHRGHEYGCDAHQCRTQSEQQIDPPYFQKDGS